MASTNTQHGNNGGIVRGLASSRHYTGGSVPVPPIQQTNTAPSTPTQTQTQTRNQSHSQIPLPRYFLVRPNVTRFTASGAVTTPGPIVPLVAVDQLPEGFNLLGIPRELSLEQTAGLVNLGTVARDPEFYQVYMSEQKDAQQQQRLQQVQQRQKQLAATVEEARRLVSSAAMVAAPATPTLTASSLRSSSSSSSSSSPPMSIIESPPASDVGRGATHPIGGIRNRDGTNLSSPDPYLTMQLYPQLQQQQPPPPPPSYQAVPASASATAPAPLPPSSNLQPPVDRMLRSWYPPTSPSAAPAPAPPSPRYKTASTSTSTPTPINPTARPTSSNTNPNAGGSVSSANGGERKRPKACRHWCVNGTCRYGNACRYAHMMPTDPEGLREVGLSMPPQWWVTAVSMAWGPNGRQPRSGGGGGGGGGGGSRQHVPGRGGSVSGGGSKKTQKDKDKDKEREAVGRGNSSIRVGGGLPGASSGGAAGAQAPITTLAPAPVRQGVVGRQAIAAGEQQRRAEQVILTTPALTPARAPARVPAPQENLVDI